MSQDNKYIINIYIIMMIVGMMPMFFFSETYLFYKINAYHNVFLDNLCYYISYLGNGYTFIFMIILLILLKSSKKYIFSSIMSLVLLTVIVKLMKLFMFEYRPSLIIPKENLQIVKNIILKQKSSFPSGHATIIFAMVSLIALFARVSLIQCFLLVSLAILVAYSRVYLGQHFYRDVYFGGLIGGASSILCYQFLDSILPN